jgi:transposase InsO family protein
MGRSSTTIAPQGLDLVGPLQKAPGGYTHLLVAIDKFSKWIKVRPLNSIRSEQAVAFFTNIIHRFGVPNSIITDNGTQFTGRKFLDFCEDHHIRVDWAAVAHPMTNGQVERAEGSGPETSRWATWSFGCDRTPEGGTSSRLPGKGRSSSPKF